MSNPIPKFYQSFSGTDTIAFLMMPGCTPICIGSLTTISYSMFRNKKPVINIGRTNINGVTRGSRIFAGTMIFTLINQHWLRELQTQWSEKYNYGNGYLANIGELKVDELPLFDIMIVSANEYGSSVSMFIFGIDFTDEAQTISVEDLFTENTFSFIARDVSVFKKFNVTDTLHGNSGYPAPIVTVARDKAIRTFAFDSEYLDWKEVGEKAKEYANTQIKIEEIVKREYESRFVRDLYWSGSKNPFVGNDVFLVQQALNVRHLYEGELDGIYSSSVADAVRLFQSEVGYPVTGTVDRRTYNALVHEFEGEDYKLAVGIIKNGTDIYANPFLSSSVSGILNYGESVEYNEIVSVTDNGTERLFLKTARGFICADDIFSYDFNNDTINYPTLGINKTNDTAYVILLQNALSRIYDKDYTSFKYGVFDKVTEDYVKKFQQDYGQKYGLQSADGEVGPDVWIAMEDVAGGNLGVTVLNNYTVHPETLPGNYNVNVADIMSGISKFNVKFEAEGKIKTKATVVSYFPSGNSKTMSSTIDAVNDTKISLRDFKEAMYYDIEEGCMPNKVEFFVYPFDGEPYKWIITFV